MNAIAYNKKPDWAAIRAEYIGGGISQRALAKKHGVSAGYLMNKANVEGWKAQRSRVESKAIAKAEQKAADAAANNAVLIQEIQREILEKIKAIINRYPIDATEIRQQKDGKTLVYKLRDLTAALKDLTSDTPNDVAINTVSNMQTIADLINNPLPDIEIEDVVKQGGESE